MKKYVICPVGTSLLGNFKRASNINHDHNHQFFTKELVEWFQQDLKSDKPKECAEYSSIKKFHQQNLDDQLNIYLMASDTVDGGICALAVAEIFETINYINEVKVFKIKDFNTKDKDSYEKGINNFYHQIDSIIDSLQKDTKFDISKQLIFNASGGFKILVPTLTTIAQLYHCQTIYIHELSKNLLTFKNIPINFDSLLLENMLIDLKLKFFSNNKYPHYQIRNYTKLKEYGFIDKKHNITGLGNLFYKLGVKSLATSERMFGYYAEDKIYVYHLKNSKFDNFNHSTDYHYVDSKGNMCNMELDFTLSSEKSKNQTIYEVWEVKSALYFCSDIGYDRILTQVAKQLKYVENLKNYKLILYAFNDSLKEEVKNTFSKLKNDLKRKDISFKCEFITLGKVKNIGCREHPLKEVFSHEIDSSDMVTL